MIVDSDAKHEAVGAVIHKLTVLSEQIIAASVDDLDLHLVPVDFACTVEDVQDVRDVLVGEGIRIVVIYHARLSDRRCTNDHKSDRAGAYI